MSGDSGDQGSGWHGPCSADPTSCQTCAHCLEMATGRRGLTFPSHRDQALSPTTLLLASCLHLAPHGNTITITVAMFSCSPNFKLHVSSVCTWGPLSQPEVHNWKAMLSWNWKAWYTLLKIKIHSNKPQSIHNKSLLRILNGEHCIPMYLCTLSYPQM